MALRFVSFIDWEKCPPKVYFHWWDEFHICINIHYYWCCCNCCYCYQCCCSLLSRGQTTEKSTFFFKELTPRSWTLWASRPKENNIQNQRQTNTSHCPTKTNSKMHGLPPLIASVRVSSLLDFFFFFFFIISLVSYFCNDNLW